MVQYIEARFSHLAGFQHEYQQDQRPISLYKGQPANVDVLLKCRHSGIEQTVVQMVDCEEGTVLKTWLVEVEGESAVAEKSYTVTQLRGTHAVTRFNYKNIFDIPMTLGFLSSRPSVLKIEGLTADSTLTFAPQESKDLEVTLASTNPKRSDDEVKLYIYDVKGGDQVCETLLFKI